MTIDEARTALIADVSAHPPPCEAESEDAEPESVGVALSGGGVRAALFSLGVLIGLADCGANRRVRHISSVSGGSIVNGAIAQSCDFGSLTSAEEFRSVAEPIAEILCRRGAFISTFFLNKTSLAAFARFVAQSLGVVAGVGIVASSSVAGLVEDGRLDRMPWGWIVLGGAILLVAVAFLWRGVAQEAIYASLLGHVPPPEGDEKKRTDRLEELPAHAVTTNVIVATDLVSGKPVYFSRAFVLCPAFGWGKPARTRTASAVYASAAFPAVFPAKRFDRRKFRFQNGNASPPFPHTLKLTDGGVHNNLGTDWFDMLDDQRTRELWHFGNLDPPLELKPVARRIVVNAGAASREVRRVRPFLALPRIMSVLYDNTVAPRLRDMRETRDTVSSPAPFVIDISESPFEIARRHAAVKQSNLSGDEQEIAETYCKRAKVIVDWLGKKSEGYWINFARTTSNAPTKLTKAGLESGARMIFHGYLSAIVVMNILYDAAPEGGIPQGVKDESYFIRLAERSQSAGIGVKTDAAVNSPTDQDLARASAPVIDAPASTREG